jgi:iron complex outermembrane recepter protein
MIKNSTIRWFFIPTLIHCVAATTQAQETSPTLKAVVITAPAPQPSMHAQPSALGHVTDIDIQKLVPAVTGLDQVLADEGVAVWDASASLGMATGLSVRGFAIGNQGNSQIQASRNFLNGHADIAWRFARDPATLERVELISGHDATLLGAGSPAASIHFTSKSPTGKEFQKFGFTAGTTGALRATLDKEIHLQSIQLRGILAVQRNDKSIEGVQDERNVALLSASAPIGPGTLRLDTEYHQLQAPYSFGTAYAAGKFWYDQPYVDQRASANRQYHRHAAYWEQPLGANVDLALHWQRVRSTREETLIGFFDIKNAQQLRGYYRTLSEHNTQADKGLKLSGRFATGEVAHTWAAVAQQHQQRRDFSGPQNIGGFALDLDNPVFPVNLAALTLSPRYAFEDYRERGIGLADTARWGRWDLRAGVRRTALEISSATSPTAPLAKAVDVQHTSASLGAGFRINDAQRLWVTHTESFLPNRGRLASGEFLPPSLGKQWETGWEYKRGPDLLSLAAFDLRQTNLPARDPAVPDAFVLIGSKRSTGAELRSATKRWAIDWRANLTWLHARVDQQVSATQRSHLVGMPSAYGALHASKKISPQWQPWASVQAVNRRPGDDKASFSAPGYSVLNLGTKSQHSQALQWGVGLDNVFDKRYVRALTGADNVWQGPRRKFSAWLELATQ